MKRVVAKIDGQDKQVALVKKGRDNSRIKEDDATESRLIPSSHIDWDTIVTDDRPIIPITPLRYLYRTLRKSKPDGIHCMLFDLLCPNAEATTGKGAGLFQRLFEESVAQFARYDNRGEHFVANDRREDRASVFAKNLIPLFQTGKCRIDPNEEDLQFTFGGYEVSTLTTSRSKFDDGCPARKSGQGGMDFLFRSCDGGLPVVGEVKAATETVGPFFALLQAMMYASELVTKPQWMRLTRWFSEPFGKLVEVPSPRVDIYLIFEKTGIVEAEVEQVKRFTCQLFEEPATCLSHSVRRVVAFAARIENGEAVMEKVFRVGS